MRIISAQFARSSLRPEDYPKDGRPEFAFVGRSNVGKSTLLNMLLGRRGLAKTSKTPGKTRTINFFDVNGRLYFVDLPGYGYAKVPKTMKGHWATVMTTYLRSRAPLRLAVQLLDARHKPTDRDHEMVALLDEAHVPTLLVATKIDKMNRSERTVCFDRIRHELGLDDALIIGCSGATGEGRNELWRVIEDVLTQPKDAAQETEG